VSNGDVVAITSQQIGHLEAYLEDSGIALQAACEDLGIPFGPAQEDFLREAVRLTECHDCGLWTWDAELVDGSCEFCHWQLHDGRA